MRTEGEDIPTAISGPVCFFNFLMLKDCHSHDPNARGLTFFKIFKEKENGNLGEVQLLQAQSVLLNAWMDLVQKLPDPDILIQRLPHELWKPWILRTPSAKHFHQ